VAGQLRAWEADVRLADFALWGMRLAEAMGYGANGFMQAYEHAIAKKWVGLIADNSFANWMLTFLAQVGGSWRGTATQLLQQIPPDQKSMKGIPETAVAVGRELNQLTPALGRIGIVCRRKGHEWMLQNQQAPVGPVPMSPCG